MEHFAELVGAIVVAIGGLKGFEYARHRVNSRRHNGENDRRKHNSLSERDREYVKQAVALTSADMSRELGAAIREEGTKTRGVLHDMERAILSEVRRSA